MQHITPEMDIHEMGNVMRHGEEQVAKMHPKPKGLSVGFCKRWTKPEGKVKPDYASPDFVAV